MKKYKKELNKWLLIFVVLVVIVLIYLMAFSDNHKANVSSNDGSSKPASAGATSSAPGYQLTAPSGVLPLHPTGNGKLDIFGVSITKDGFNPSVIVIKDGDGAGLSLKAADGTYDFVMPQEGLGTGQIEEGQSAFLTFVPTKSGEYVFQCQSYCPYGNRITGKVVVLPQ